MDAVNFNLSFFDCLADFFKNCFSNSLCNFSEIENFMTEWPIYILVFMRIEKNLKTKSKK